MKPILFSSWSDNFVSGGAHESEKDNKCDYIHKLFTPHHNIVNPPTPAQHQPLDVPSLSLSAQALF